MFLLLLGLVAMTSAFAGSAVIGSVAGSMNATVGGQALLPNATLFSGDSLQVKDGVAIVAVGKTSRMVFGRDTAVSFLRDTNEVTVLLGRGNVSLFHPEDSGALRVKAGAVSVIPAAGFKTLGEIAMLNGSLIITTKEGSLLVEQGGQTVKVAKGKTLTITSQSAGSPQGGPKTGPHVSGGEALQIAGTAASGASLITSVVAVSRAGDAKTAAGEASTTASSALSAAQSGATAASGAASTATNVGCALNTLGAAVGIPSPFTPASGTC
jgi:hypothetical protein